MKIRDTYLLKEAGGSYFLFPVGQNAVDFKRMLELNETGYYIANQLLNDISYDDLLKKIVEEYEASEEEICILKEDLNLFLHKLQEREILE